VEILSLYFYPFTVATDPLFLFQLSLSDSAAACPKVEARASLFSSSEVPCPNCSVYYPSDSEDKDLSSAAVILAARS